MALDLLTPDGRQGWIEHLYRHDCESFAWVLLWICFRYEDGKPIARPPFDDFKTSNLDQCRQAKLKVDLSEIKVTSSFTWAQGSVATALVAEWRKRERDREMDLEHDMMMNIFETAGSGISHDTSPKSVKAEKALAPRLKFALNHRPRTSSATIHLWCMCLPPLRAILRMS